MQLHTPPLQRTPGARRRCRQRGWGGVPLRHRRCPQRGWGGSARCCYCEFDTACGKTFDASWCFLGLVGHHKSSARVLEVLVFHAPAHGAALAIWRTQCNVRWRPDSFSVPANAFDPKAACGGSRDSLSGRPCLRARRASGAWAPSPATAPAAPAAASAAVPNLNVTNQARI